MQKHLATVTHALSQYKIDFNFALFCKAIITIAVAHMNQTDQAMLAVEQNIPSSLMFLVDWFQHNYISKQKISRNVIYAFKTKSDSSLSNMLTYECVLQE